MLAAAARLLGAGFFTRGADDCRHLTPAECRLSFTGAVPPATGTAPGLPSGGATARGTAAMKRGKLLDVADRPSSRAAPLQTLTHGIPSQV